MNRPVFIIILSAFFILLIQNNSFAQESQEITPTAESENKMFSSSINPSYQNQLYGFSLNAPVNWTVQENSELVGGNEAAIVSFYSDKQSEEYTPNFFILYHNLTPEYIDLLKSYSQEELLDQLSSMFIGSNTKMINKDIKVYSDGYKITVEYAQTTKISENDFATLHRETVLYVLQNGETYSLQLAALPEDFDEAVKGFRNSVDTFYVGKSQSVQGISGQYRNNELNFGFIIPTGWAGIQGSDSSTILIIPATYQKLANDLPDYAISVSVLDESFFGEPSTPQTDKNNCTDDISYKLINKIPLRETSSKCDELMFKGYNFAVDGKIVGITFLTKNVANKEKLVDFDKLISTLKVDNPMPIKDSWRKAQGLGIYEQALGNGLPTIKYYSKSQVTDFVFDQKTNRFSFTVSESSNSGTTIIPASKAIDGPYKVVVDGKSVKTDLNNDDIEGITEVAVDYQSGVHTISVEGTQLGSSSQVPKKSICGTGTIEKDGVCVPAKQEKSSETKSGGCLIATATYGTELAPQVQLLREIRDHTLLQTNSGSSFMTSFNAIYYSFSPTVADLERQNPIFKESVKVTIAPMLSTLSILNYVNIDSEQKMLGYGVGIILINAGIYVVTPTVIILKIRTRFNINKRSLETI